MASNWKASRELVRIGQDEWQMIMKGGYKVGIIVRQHYGTEVWFRSVTWSPDPLNRVLVGYCKSLDDAAKALWIYKTYRP